MNDAGPGGVRESVVALGRGQVAGGSSERRSKCASGRAAQRYGTSLGVAVN